MFFSSILMMLHLPRRC